MKLSEQYQSEHLDAHTHALLALFAKSNITDLSNDDLSCKC